MSRTKEIEGIDCGEEIDGIVWGWLLEHRSPYFDEVDNCPTCDQPPFAETTWEPVGMFVTPEKFAEWMNDCGYEEMPEEYRIKTVPVDEGPIGHSHGSGFIPEGIADEDIEEYIMREIEGREKFQEDNV